MNEKAGVSKGLEQKGKLACVSLIAIALFQGNYRIAILFVISSKHKSIKRTKLRLALPYYATSSKMCVTFE